MNIAELVEQVTEIFEINSLIRGVKVITRIDDDVPEEITTDSNRVRQVLFNLISNAMKFTYEGQVTIEVKCAPGDQLRISVIDTGVGITAKRQRNLLQKEIKIQPTQTGLGIGLNISNNLAY